MITQLLCLSVTSCDDRHCNRAGEIVFFYFSSTPPPNSSTTATTKLCHSIPSYYLGCHRHHHHHRNCSHPTSRISLQLTGKGCVHILRPPTAGPPLPGTHPPPVTPAAWWTNTPSGWGREANMTGMSLWKRKPVGGADTRSHTLKNTLVCTFCTLRDIDTQ